MRLSEFITCHQEAILAECEAFARTQLPAAADMDATALRDHAAQVLAAIALDMHQPQTGQEQRQKSKGLAVKEEGAEPTAAEIHGSLRATAGFNVNQTTAEYRALRACVIRLWLQSGPALGRDEVFELVRFNEAMDQALAESILHFAAEAAHMRNLFLGVLSHELRTPLSTIVASAHTLVLAAKQDKPVPGVPERVLRSSKRMESMLDDLLDYVRSGLGEGLRVAPADGDMDKICARVIHELAGLFPDRSVVLETVGDLHGVWDEHRIAQAVSNLISNAIKYGEAGGPVQVHVSGEQPHQVVLSVHNAGPEIPAETRDSLFEPLVRGQGGQPGHYNLGLGLYIVREIVTAHGGTISVESAAHLGTVFSVTLPRHAPTQENVPFSSLYMN